MTDIINQIRTMRAEGVTIARISAQTGLTRQRVSNLIRQARAENIMPARVPSQTPVAIQTRLRDVYHLNVGRMPEIYMNLSEDQLRWVASEAAKVGCETLAEYLAELVRDAHAEATA